MNRKRLVFALLAVSAACLMLLCKFETASGPTPYTVFDGKTVTSSSNDIGKGVKTFTIPGSLPIFGNRGVTISAASNDSIYMNGIISSYDGKTGILSVDVDSIKGSGSFSNWNVVLVKTFQELQDSLRQAYVDMKFGMFLHFNMSTFDRCCCPECISVTGEWGKAWTNEKEFNPTAINCGQWAEVAKSAGCKYVVLTSKHHDGFCLWPTKYTTHCVTNSSYSGDIIRQFVDSVRSRGLKPGLYYSMRDFSNSYDTNFVKGQLTELLSNYGDLACLWFDGWGWDMGYKKVPYKMVSNLIKSIQPHCLLIENNHEYTTAHSEIVEYEIPIDGVPQISSTPPPSEGNEPICIDSKNISCWFWHPTEECQIRSASAIVSKLQLCNSRNASYLLDLTPDRRGLIPDCQVETMKQVGDLRNK